MRLPNRSELREGGFSITLGVVFLVVFTLADLVHDNGLFVLGILLGAAMVVRGLWIALRPRR